jgi:hypothetical protein
VSVVVVEPSLASFDTLERAEAVCLLVAEDERPLRGAAGYLDWRLCGALSRVLKDNFFTGRPDERLLMPTRGQVPAQRLFAVGLGPSRSVTALGLENALGATAQMLLKAQAKTVALALPHLPQFGDETMATLLTRGFVNAWPGELTVFGSKALGAKLAA